jgi:hypothetical protein
MNRKAIFLLISAIIYFFVNEAAAKDKLDYRIGIKIIPGLDWTRAKSSDITRNGMGVGFSFGAMADFKLSNNYYIGTEVMVTSMTNYIKLKEDQYLSSSNGNYTNIEYTYKLRYIELPILFKYKTAKEDKLNFWFQGGFAPNILIGNKATIFTSNKDNSQEFPEKGKYFPNSDDNNDLDFDNHKDDIVPVRISMILGAGIEVDMGSKTKFYSGLRFNKGFTDILATPNSIMINNVFGLELGFFF